MAGARGITPGAGQVRCNSSLNTVGSLFGGEMTNAGRIFKLIGARNEFAGAFRSRASDGIVRRRPTSRAPER